MVVRASPSLDQALRQRVLVLNTSAANPAWSRLSDTEWGSPQFAQSPNLNLTRPDLVREWNTELLNAGAHILEAPSLGATLSPPQNMALTGPAAASGLGRQSRLPVRRVPDRTLSSVLLAPRLIC
jgi:methionine synthase I (cobalamin-dependent)